MNEPTEREWLEGIYPGAQEEHERRSSPDPERVDWLAQELSPRERVVFDALRESTMGDLEQTARDVVTTLHLSGQLAGSSTDLTREQLRAALEATEGVEIAPEAWDKEEGPLEGWWLGLTGLGRWWIPVEEPGRYLVWRIEEVDSE